MSELAIQVDRLSKRYRLGAHKARYQTLRDALAALVRAPWRRAPEAETLWALRDVSFEIGRGEVVGIIGRNGAGKSTLLKILSRITEPSEGAVEIRGRVGALLEVGTGFHPELTGRENVFLNGAILGMRHEDIQRQFDAIVAFADMDRFIDTPVKHYSSGMQVRLAFAVAAHLEPDVLLIDEVLAVGDAAFQRKCLGRMEESTRQGRTVLFVSHNMPAVMSMCTRAYLLEEGRVVASGPTDEVVTRYMEVLGSRAMLSLVERTDRTGSGAVRLTSASIDGGTAGMPIRSGDRLRIALGYENPAEQRDAHFSVRIYDNLARPLYYLDTAMVGALIKLERRGTVVCTTAPVNLSPGRCVVDLGVRVRETLADLVGAAASFEVEPMDFFGTGKHFGRALAPVLLQHHWSSEP